MENGGGTEQPEDIVLATVNAVLNDSSLDEEKFSDMTEAMMGVLSGQIQAGTAAKQYGVEAEVLQPLVQAAQRRLAQQSEQNGTSKSPPNDDGEGATEKAKDTMGLESEEVELEEEGAKQQHMEENNGGKANDSKATSSKSNNNNNNSGNNKEKKRKSSSKRSAANTRDFITPLREITKSVGAGRRESRKRNSDADITTNSQKKAQKKVDEDGKQNDDGKQQQEEEKEVAAKPTENETKPAGKKRGRKRKLSAVAAEDAELAKAAEQNGSSSSQPEQGVKKRRQRSKLDVLKEEARMMIEGGVAGGGRSGTGTSSSSSSTINNTEKENNAGGSELDSVEMALTVYRGTGALVAVPRSPRLQLNIGGTEHLQQPQQKQNQRRSASSLPLTVQRTRRSTANTNLLAVEGNKQSTGMKALTWRDTPPRASQSQQQKKEGNGNGGEEDGNTTLNNNNNSTLLDDTLNQNNSSQQLPKHTIIKDNPRWHQFPRVVEDVVDEVLSRMLTRNAAQQEKQDAMRAAILDIIRHQHTIKKAQEPHGKLIGESTLRRYSRDAKVQLDLLLGPDVISDAQLNHLLKDGPNTTLVQLRDLMESQPSSSSMPRSSSRMPLSSVPRPSSRTPHIARSKSAAGKKTGKEDPLSDSAKRDAIIPQQQQTPVTTTTTTKGSSQHHRAAIKTSLQPQLDAAEKAPPPPPPPGANASIPALLGGTKSQGQLLLTQKQAERVKFRGTKHEFRKVIAEHLAQRSEGSVREVSSLIANFLHAQCTLLRQQQHYNMPYQLMYGAMCVLARHFDMDHLDFTDTVLDEGDDDDEQEHMD